MSSLEWISARAPSSRPGVWFAVSRTNFAIAPSCREALDKTAQVLIAIRRVLHMPPDFMLSQVT
ncbi:MAG: hypothetical protein ACJ746_14045, partial [Bryobacteraceae bacterium]